MELRHIRYFIAVAEELHFNHAAERLSIAQPAISQQIQDLERELGISLFHRTKRHVALTAAGQVFLERAYQLIAQSEQAVLDAQRAARGETGQLALGFANFAMYDDLLPTVLRLFRQRTPLIQLRLYELPPSKQVEQLHTAQIDIGFLCPPPDSRDIASSRVSREPAVVVLPQKHHLAHRSEIALPELADEDWITYPRHLDPALFQQRLNAFQRAGFVPRIVQESNYPHIILALVAAGLGIALQPRPIQNMRREGVIFVPLKEDDWEWGELYAAWRRDHVSPILTSFLDTLKEVTIAL